MCGEKQYELILFPLLKLLGGFNQPLSILESLFYINGASSTLPATLAGSVDLISPSLIVIHNLYSLTASTCYSDILKTAMICHFAAEIHLRKFISTGNRQETKRYQTFIFSHVTYSPIKLNGWGSGNMKTGSKIILFYSILHLDIEPKWISYHI